MSQSGSGVTTGTILAGNSTSDNRAILAKTFSFEYPVYAYAVDSSSHQFIFSTRQKTDAAGQYSNKGHIGAIDYKTDSINWLLESGVHRLSLNNNNLFFSGDNRTSRYNKLHGFEEIKYPSRVMQVLPDAKTALVYASEKSDTLQALQITDGVLKWEAVIPGNENWIDAKPFNDSISLVAAAGVHALNVRSGLVWTYSLSTSAKIAQTLTYSPANNSAIQRLNKVTRTADFSYVITEIASNILIDGGTIFFAAKDKMISTDVDGKLRWELDLSAYPVSKCYLLRNGSDLLLVNFGIAKYGDNYVIHGKPFMLLIDDETGKVKSNETYAGIGNLVDFVRNEDILMFADKQNIYQYRSGKVELVLSLDPNVYGRFAEFIHPSGFFRSVKGNYSLLGTNGLFFKADNNKIYMIAKNKLNYECHLDELYKLSGMINGLKLISGEKVSVLIDEAGNVLHEFNFGGKVIVVENRIFFINENKIILVDIPKN